MSTWAKSSSWATSGASPRKSLDINLMSGQFAFGRAVVPPHHVFLTRKNVFAFPSFKPIAEGHVLVASRRVVAKLADLTEVESIDLWLTGIQIARMLRTRYNKGFGLVIQNGKDAGQTIPQVHLHVVPDIQPGEAAISETESGRPQLSDEKMAQIAHQYKTSFNTMFSP